MTTWVWMILSFAFTEPGDETSRVVVQPLEAPAFAGDLQSWQSTGELIVRLDNGETRRIAATDIDDVFFEHRASDVSPTAWEIALVDDSRWRADLLHGDEQTLDIQSPIAGRLTIPIERIRTLRSRDVLRAATPVALDEDQLMLRDGAVLLGAWIRCDASTLFFQDGDSPRPCPWDKVLCVIPASTTKQGAPGMRLLVRLIDGSGLVASAWKYGNGRIEVTSPITGRHDLHATDIRALEVLGGRRVWLGDLPPATFQHTPYMTDTWTMRVDAAADGGPLRLAGREWNRGLGLHARSRVSWSLDDHYLRFTAEAGLDDSAGPLGDADLIVFVDGRPAVEHRGLKKGQTPRRIDVDLRGARELTIEVGFGRGGDVQDRVDLVKAALLRKRTAVAP